MTRTTYHPSFKKIFIRFLLITIVFLCIRLTVNKEDENIFFSITNLFYYSTAFLFFIITWELNDWLIKNHLKKDLLNRLEWFSGMKILGLTLLTVAPIFALTYYLAIFHFSDTLDIVDVIDPWLQFRSDFLRACLIAVTVVVFNLFYFSGKVKKDLEQKMMELENEVMQSKYKSLKNQISPHFLFNSLNTLTSLMYEDRDLASDFVSRLSSCYRYILENEEEDLISLEKELNFLDSFIFMMDVRHKISLQITTKIDLKANNYVIPTLSLQMLIENALKHNYYSKEHPLVISITNKKNECIIVENTVRIRKDSQESTKKGLENIKKRFSFYTDDKVKVIQENDTFKVSLPLLKKEVKRRTPLK
ncbi:sensor histidine kinase [Flavobacterium sp. J27]|uniref:sensor histidine kinase n=1 Tax=Flavobacterium sp. J27 TaxID=2060419 RepID=UPI001031B058|nr:histidine kinase [Flavobacterium sp. J27]